MKADAIGQLRWKSVFKLGATCKCDQMRFADTCRAESAGESFRYSVRLTQKSTNMLVLAAFFQRRRFMTGTATTALVGLGTLFRDLAARWNRSL
jgi:hypothetical protein